jgi:prepilin-type N-terminal cleavage/methylation domain-containing protein
MNTKNRSGLTLVEIMIVVLIISVIAIGLILLLDPLTMVNKGVDAQRKTDLNNFKKKLEEFYNDKGCYPTTSQVCFTGGVNGDVTTKTNCIMCGKEVTSPLSPLVPSYMDKIPCDPKYSTNVYLYAIANAASAAERACPRSYAVYATLGVPKDNDSIKLGCGEGGCGPTGNGYDYGVSSPQISITVSNAFACLSNISFQCNVCGTNVACQNNSTCRQDKIYATNALCKAATGAP